MGQRRREIAVRLALGATPESVVRALLGEGARVVAMGVALGLAGAFALTRVLSSMLYGVSATDGSMFAGAAAFVGLVAVPSAPAWPGYDPQGPGGRSDAKSRS